MSAAGNGAQTPELRRQLGRVKRAVVRKVKTVQGKPLTDEEKPAQPPPPDTVTVPPGNHVDPVQASKLPVALIVLWNVPDDQVAAIVDEVARAQVATIAFRPMFVTRSDDFAVFRRHGYLFEYVMPHDDWLKVRPTDGWRDYVDARLASIVDTYRPAQVLTVSNADEAVTSLLALAAAGR